jgi:hypothetical protein
MDKIVYKIQESGRATDLRFCLPDYKLEANTERAKLK